MPMTQKAARKLLQKKAPPGEFLAYINPREASWLRGMGGSGRKTKAGVRSFQVSYNPMDAPVVSGKDTGYKNPEAVTSVLESMNRNQYGQTVNTPHDNTAGGYVPSTQGTYASAGLDNPVHNLNPTTGSGIQQPPNLGNPLAGQSGYDTRTPQGPGSVTDPNDPYGIQKKIAQGAGELIDREYVAPTLTPDERIAATSAQTQQARDMVQKMAGTGQEAYGQAAGVGKAVSGYTPEQVGAQSFLGGKGVGEYMSPHTENVIQGMQQSAMDTMQKQRGALQAQHQMAGAGIGSRGALENAAMAAEVQKGLGRQVAGALEGAYGQAAQMKESDMARAQQAARYNQQAGLAGQDVRLRGAQQQMAATTEGRGATAQDIGLVSQVGADVEGRDQNVLDETMSDFYEERDWGRDNLAMASNIAGTLPTGSTTTTTGAPQYKKKDKFGRIITGATSGWLASGGNPMGAVVGGFGGAFS